MKKVKIFILLFSLKSNCYSQCSDYYNKIMDLMKRKYCSNIDFSQDELVNLLKKMAINCPEETSKFNKWWSETGTSDTKVKNYFCGSDNKNTSAKSNIKKLKDDNIHYTYDGSHKFIKKESLNNQCFHIGQFSVDAVANAASNFCNRCKTWVTKAMLDASDRDYKLIKRYTGEEDVDENGNIINVSANSTTTASQNIPQTNSVINQYKENPIAYSNSKKNETTAFSNLKEDDKKKLLDDLKNINKINVFDEKEIDNLFDVKDGGIKVVQEARHIDYPGIRGRNPFFNIVLLSGYKAKFNGVLDIDVSIDEYGMLKGVSTASTPKDNELNNVVNNYIFDNYSNNRQWDPARGSNNRFIASSVTYKENFRIDNSKKEVVAEKLKPNEKYIFEDEYEIRNKEYVASNKDNIRSFFSRLSSQISNPYDKFMSFFENIKKELKNLRDLKFLDEKDINAEDYNTDDKLQTREKEALEKSNIYTHGKFRLENKTWELVSGSGTIINGKKRLVARIIE